MKVTIRTIAEEAGVSEATVSYVLNDKGKVSDKVRERIKAIVKKHNYNPRRKAQPTIKGVRHKTVAVAFPYYPHSSYQEKCGDLFTNSILAGIEKTLAAAGMGVSLCTLTDRGTLPPNCSEDLVDGAITFGENRFGKGLTSLPNVSLFAPLVPTTGDGVYPDHAPCGAIAAKRLASLGCKHCVFLNTQMQHVGFVARKRAFMESLATLEIEGTAIEGPPDGAEATPAELVRRFVAECPDADGIFIPGSDVHVAAFCMELQKQNKPPSEDLHVISCLSNLEILAPFDLGIDFIDIRLRELGETAAETLLWRLQNKKAPLRRVMVAPRLIPKDQ